MEGRGHEKRRQVSGSTSVGCISPESLRILSPAPQVSPETHPLPYTACAGLVGSILFPDPEVGTWPKPAKQSATPSQLQREVWRILGCGQACGRPLKDPGGALGSHSW